ncbi:hypothetical protein FHG87_012546 [Trinorchestia longiramus]|nr:hypothetical protein FHG87_012546 [Trinorchestia longiramus]
MPSWENYPPAREETSFDFPVTSRREAREISRFVGPVLLTGRPQDSRQKPLIGPEQSDHTLYHTPVYGLIYRSDISLSHLLLDFTTNTMNTVAVILAVVVGCATAEVAVQGPSTIVRVPEHDSAIIQSHRLGGNFAYSTHEAHAYGVQTPIIKQRVVPKGVTYHQGQPIVKTYTSFVKQQVPQYGVVHTKHSVPTVQYATGQQVVTSRVSTPVQYVAGAAPIQYAAHPVSVQYAANPVPVQYAAGVTPIQYITGTGPVQYISSGAAPVQYITSGAAPVQVGAVSPAKYITDKAKAVEVVDA